MEEKFKQIENTMLEIDNIVKKKLKADEGYSYCKATKLLCEIIQSILGDLVVIRMFSEGKLENYYKMKRYPGFFILDGMQIPNSGASKSISVWIPSDKKKSFIIRFTTISKSCSTGLFCFPLEVLRQKDFIEKLEKWLSREGAIVESNRFGSTYKLPNK